MGLHFLELYFDVLCNVVLVPKLNREVYCIRLCTVELQGLLGCSMPAGLELFFSFFSTVRRKTTARSML